ncbi:MAG TPA: adenylate/guanylate cyclase domain-containing protein [Frankiaceae bacterium]|nr:adenylate/guanylate cyclase domain-containing protein [Frankiaceae bacterium]
MTSDERDAAVTEAAEAIVGPAVHTRASACAAAAVPPERATRLWRAMGFAEPADDAVLFTEQDVAALRIAAALLDAGVVDEEGLVALARSMAQALSRLAVSHAAIAGSYVLRAGADATLARHAAELVPNVGDLLGYVWRRHLVAAAESAVVTLLGAGETDVPVTVGFADLVGFTELSRELSAEELAELVEVFESTAAYAVAEHGGRVVKTLGDEVMFTTADVRAGVDLGLALAEGAGALGREVRVGVAYGPVLARLGDVFGPTVNVASRLTGLARPGTVLVDREAANALRDDPAYDVAPIGRRAVRGYAHLAPFRVRKASRS